VEEAADAVAAVTVSVVEAEGVVPVEVAVEEVLAPGLELRARLFSSKV